ncbi:MAG TPA: ATP-binding protein [Phycisphaerales bacterium]|nr:ATP-binding protein [Phycisphaerales bacterium]
MTMAPTLGAGAVVTPDDLAELLTAFNEVTGRLARTHETLRSEVSRLERELHDSREQLRRARHLAALGEMAAGIAHEVRNPLGSIRLSTRVLAEELADRPAARDAAGRIDAAVQRLNAVVQDVLLFARDGPLRLETVPAASALNEAGEACEELLANAAIKLERANDSSEDVCVRIDSGLMHMALVNLIRNAAEAIAESGASGRERIIRLEARRRRLLNAEGRRESLVSLSVRDSGPGIPPELVERVFDPFFTTRSNGTGLGLAIVHRIADAHGGRVAIRANGGQQPGTTVELLVPDSARALPGSEGA